VSGCGVGHPVDGHRDVLEGDVERGLGLVHSDLGGHDAGEGQDPLGDPVRQGLDEVDRLPLDDAHDAVGHAGVVDGVGHRVGDGGHGGTALPQVEDDIDREELALLTFEGQDAVVATGGQADEADPVGGRGDGGAH